jgi:hypothetical protein
MRMRDNCPPVSPRLQKLPRKGDLISHSVKTVVEARWSRISASEASSGWLWGSFPAISLGGSLRLRLKGTAKSVVSYPMLPEVAFPTTSSPSIYAE